jgi:NADPH:quinone reductase-like Zn-dependent oxidoreductase
MASKPDNSSHAQAATVPTRATLALHFLRKANIQSCHKVLIYGASGGVGTFAIQLAKHFGAEVTGVCSTANLDLVRSLGADRVLDYTVQDGTAVGGPYDVVFDAVGSKKNSSLKLRCQAALAGDGRLVSVDATAKMPAGYLDTLKDLIATGKITPIVDRVYPLPETADAHRYVEAGHKRGGVAIALTPAE